MHELTMDEVSGVSGGMTYEHGMELISAVTGVAAVLSAPAAVAFGAGVLLGAALVDAFSD